MATKLHVEIGLNGEKSITRISGEGEDLLAAATWVLNSFYRAFARNGEGEAFKRIIQAIVRDDNSPVWEKNVGPS